MPFLSALLSPLRHAPWSLESSYNRRVSAATRRPGLPAPLVVGEADLVPLPTPVRNYLRLAGVVGRPRVQNLRARFHGEIRSKPDGPWMPFTAEQFNFFDPLERLFLIESTLRGVPFTALHVFAGTHATMRVRIASTITVVEAAGPEMDQSETVTTLNDMCVLAPATLVDPALRWDEIDSRSVKVTFTHAGHTVSAVLQFGDEGELTRFESNDRYQTADGKNYLQAPWLTPLGDYRDFAGRRVAVHGEARWRMPAGDLSYGRFELLAIDYNLAET